jgi:hypothetical protein
MKISRGESIVVVDSSGNESTCITSTGGLNANGYPLFYTENASTTAALKAYGVSIVDGSTTDTKVYTIGAPITGMRKTILMYSTAADTLGSSRLTIVGTASTANYFIGNSTAIASDDHYLTFQRPYTAVELIGLSTLKYGILSVICASTVSTIASTATGILGGIGTSNSSGVTSS